MSEIAFVVYGVPIGKGSKTIMNGAMVDARRGKSLKHYKTWTLAVLDGAALARRINVTTSEGDDFELRDPLDGPLNVCARFYFDRPKSETKFERLRIYKTSSPDLDKLLRAILDPMTKAKLIHDDARVVSFQGSEKLYVPWRPADYRPLANGMPRVEITVTRLAATR